jgi:hypothetical protein
MPEPQATENADISPDLRPLLDQELSRLPDKYRMPIVLCDSEGRTYREVARHLGIAAGTLSGRLTTARGMLAKRLSRHGFSLSGGALLAALTPSAASAAVPAPLATATVQTAIGGGAGQTAAGVVSAKVAALAEGVMKAMLVKSLAKATTILLALGIIVAAAVVVAQADRGASGAAKVLDLGFGQRGRQVVWSPDGKTLVVVTKVEKAIVGIQFDRRGSAIRLWDLDTGRIRQTLDESPEKGLAFQQVVFSADGKTIAATVDENHPVMLPNGGAEIQ